MKFKIIAFFIACAFMFEAQAQVDRSVMPEPGPAPEINLGQPATFTLKNGMEILVVEDHNLPRVSAKMFINNKPIFEEEPGTANLLSRILGNGTQKISKNDFVEEVDFLGASISIGSQSANARSLTKYFPRIFEMMAAGALHPLFSQEEFDTQKSQLLESLKLDDKNVGAIAGRVSSVLAYGTEHPYGQYITEAAVKNITLDDVKAYYEKYYVPENSFLVILGDISTKEAKKLAKKYWKKWEGSPIPAYTLPEVGLADHLQIDFIDMPNAVQSEIRVQNTVDLKMSDEDYFATLIANQILGGNGLGTYLNLNLREDKAYTYGAYSSIGNDIYGASRFVANTSVRNAVTDSAVVQIMKEIYRLRNEKVSDKFLNRAKSKYAGAFVLRLESPSTVANYALNIKTENLPEDFYKNYLKNIEAVTAEDVMRVANKYLKPKHIRIIVAGKGSEVADKLENITLTNGETPPVVYFDKFGNQIEKPVFSKPIPKGVTTASVFADYINAIGGKEAVGKVNSILIKAAMSMRGMTIDMLTKKTNTKSLVEVSMGGNVLQKMVFDGEKGYSLARGQKMPMNAKQIEKQKAETALFPELSPSENAKLTGIETIDGKDAYAVSTSETTTKYYHTDSGLLVAVKTKVNMGPKTVTSIVHFKNYKEVNGVKLPFSIVRSTGKMSQDITVSEIKINEGVSADDFK